MNARAPKAEAQNPHVLQLRKIGNSVGVILPKELLARLNLSEGDKLHVVEQSERGVQLSPFDPTHARAMEIARKSFKTYAETFKELAK
jgi:putative addiction module antidote